MLPCRKIRVVSLLNNLFKIFRPVRLEDPYFGSLLLFKARRGLSYWEGQREFEPLGKTVALFIDATDSTGPSQAQQRHFRWVETEYGTLCETIAGRFKESGWAARLMDRGFDNEFTLSSMSIPLCRDAAESWELSFDAKRDTHLFSVSMVGREPTNVMVDG